jgi:cytidine deaminase
MCTGDPKATITQLQLEELVRVAQEASKAAYNPYSKFSVGCALLSKSGKIYTGSNIENASFSVTICAERVAASQAIHRDDRDWLAMTVVSPSRVTPCGVCRQFLSEFSPHLPIWIGYLQGGDLTGPMLVSQMLPFAMTLSPSQESNLS